MDWTRKVNPVKSNPGFHSNLCKSQQAILVFGSSFLESGNPSTIGAPKPANDSRSGTYGYIPTFSLSE